MDHLKLYVIVLFIFPTCSLHFLLQLRGENVWKFKLLILFCHIAPRQRCELWVWLACSDLSVYQGLPGPSGEKGPQGPQVRKTFNWRVCSLNKKKIKKRFMLITFCIALTVERREVKVQGFGNCSVGIYFFCNLDCMAWQKLYYQLKKDSIYI